MDDLDRAIVTDKQAVALTEDDHPNLAHCRNNLGIALWKRFERMGFMDDLDRAILVEKQAVALIPGDYPNRVGLLNNLAHALHR